MDKLWLQQYQEGVPYEIRPNTYASLVELFDSACQTHHENTAYVNMGALLTYGDIQILSTQFASFLQTLGLKKGARVALMLPNVLQYPVTLFGALKAGYTVVNTNPLYTADEIIHQMNDSEAEVIVVLANFAKTLEEALPAIPSLKQVVITEMGDLFPTFKRVLVNTVVKYFKKLIPSYQMPGAWSFRKALAKGATHAWRPVTLTHEDIALLQYTGGTTGIAKGAMLTHGNLVANVLQASAWLAPLDLGCQDIIVTALPLYHIFSLTANCLTFFSVGAKNMLITNPRDLTRFINDIKHSGFTAITGVNTLFNALLHHKNFDSIDFSHLKLALSGGMALQKSVAEQWQIRTHSPILEAYGLSETSPAVTINPMYMTVYNGSIGLPLPSTNLSIRDEAGQEVALGEQGELCIQGPQVTPGYWRKKEETKISFWADHFFRSGDIAKMDAKGFVYLVDRIKDMILISGFNVYPNEVEQVISLMPDVLEVGVIGIKDEEGNERVKACVVKRHPALTSEAVIAHCKAHLAAYKIPKIVTFHNELPKTNVGKILRRALKDFP